MANPSIVPVPRNLYTALKGLPEFSLLMVNRLPVLITPPVITVVLITAETQNQHIIMRNQVRASENSYNYGTPLFDSPWSFFLSFPGLHRQKRATAATAATAATPATAATAAGRGR